jgi:hypothetical protein
LNGQNAPIYLDIQYYPLLDKIGYSNNQDIFGPSQVKIARTAKMLDIEPKLVLGIWISNTVLSKVYKRMPFSIEHDWTMTAPSILVIYIDNLP